MTERMFYVYVLIDASRSDCRVFYVGKGQGKRLYNHWRSALQDEALESKKQEKIVRLREEGYESEDIVRIIGRYKTEPEAFAVEATLIHWMYGTQELTNIQSGHGHLWIRDRFRDGFETKPGLDIQATYRRIGERRDDQERRLREAGVFEILERLRESLHGKWSEPLMLQGQDASITLDLDDRLFIKLFIQNPNRLRVKVELRVSKAADRQHLKRILNRQGFEPQTGYYYSPYTRRLVDYEDLIEIQNRLNELERIYNKGIG